MGHIRHAIQQFWNSNGRSQDFRLQCDCKWSPWTQCSKTCGLGQESRTHQVSAQLGGKQCAGVSTRNCNLRECPGQCPSGKDPNYYKYIHGRCYFFETTSYNFTEAMNNCENAFGASGGRLFE